MIDLWTLFAIVALVLAGSLAVATGILYLDWWIHLPKPASTIGFVPTTAQWALDRQSKIEEAGLEGGN